MRLLLTPSFLLLCAAPLAAQLPAPAALPTDGMFEGAAARVGNVYITGQPTEAALHRLRQDGVTTIVNLRTPEEMQKVPFDEAALARSLGMRYVYLPVRGNEQYPYSPETLDAFVSALNGADGKVLLHCTIAWRASHLWAAYLIRERRLPVDDAIAHAHAINLMEDMSRTSGRQPVEDFLDRTLPQLRKAK